MIKRAVTYASILWMVGVLCPAHLQAKILPPRLVDLIKDSDCIAEGKVIKISEIGDVRIAHLQVMRIYKGNLSNKTLYFRASKTWACDISYAELNESGLYFLISLNRENLHQEPQELQTVLGNDKLYSIAGSGYVRLIDNGGGRLQANSYVEFPRAVSVRYIKKGDYRSIALVDTRDIVWLIYINRHRARV